MAGRRETAAVEATRKSTFASASKASARVTIDSVELAGSSGTLAAIGRSHAVIEYQPDGTILDANENALHLTGHALAELRGRHHGVLTD